MLQLSQELTAHLEQPDEVVSLVAFSVRGNTIDGMLDCQLIDLGQSQHVRKSS